MVIKKSFISLVIVFVVLVTASVQGVFGQVGNISRASDFSDVRHGFWAYDAIDWMVKNGVIKGFSDGTFRPDEMVTRAQFATIMTKCVRVDATTDEDFADVSSNSWAYKAIQLVKTYINNHTIEDKKYFKPDEPILREDVAVAIAKIMGLSTDNDISTVLENYSDGNTISSESKKYVAAVITNKIFTGYPTDTAKVLFKPDSKLTRAQLVRVIFNALVKNNLANERLLVDNHYQYEENTGISTVASVYKTVYDTDDNYVAIVGTEKITQSEYYLFLKQIKNLMQSEARVSETTDIEKFWSTKIDGKDPLEVAKEKAMDKLKEFKVELLNAKNENIVLSPDEKTRAQDVINSIIEQNGGEQVFSNLIAKDVGITLDAYKTIVSNGMIIQKFMSEKQKNMPVNEDELEKYYGENKGIFDEVTIVHILFSIIDKDNRQPLSQDKQDLAKRNADETLVKVNAGEDVKELAKKYSEDPGVVQNEGEYKFKKDGQMVKEFEDWAFSHNVNDTGIVKTQFGYHVMKKTKQSGYEEAKVSAKEAVQFQKTKNLLNEWKEEPANALVLNNLIYENLK